MIFMSTLHSLRLPDVLVLIDIQNDFCPNGALAVPGGDLIIPRVNRLAARFPHVVLTQDWHPPGHVSFASSFAGGKPLDTIASSGGLQVLWPDHCVQGTRGADFHETLESRRAQLSCGRASTRRSIPIRRSSRTIAGRPPD